MNATLLIVEDDYALRRSMVRWGARQDFTVLEAESAEDAAELLADQTVDLVILDMRLPGMSGLAFAQQLIQAERERPVLLMTAFADMESARQAMNIGVYEYFTKPFDFDDIRASIHRALQHRNLLLENRAHQAYLEEEVHRRTEELTQINDQLQREIEERKRIQDQVIQLERLGALAEMSTGVSHNLNNILTGILGPAQLIEMQSEDPNILKEAETIRLAALRATDLVKRLSQSVSGESDTPFSVDVALAVQEAIKVAQPRWKDEPESRGVTIDLKVDMQTVPPVRATTGGLHNVLLNLIFNAVDAMPDGGTLSIDVAPTSFGVRLSVSDTGIGMSEEVRRRVFEPFFTTKTTVGTGLGMSAVFTAVSSWDGRIDLQSEPGKGTTVVVDIPLWQEEYKSQSTDVISSDRSCAILVVEDEEMVRGFLTRALSRFHQVDAVVDGPAALSRFGDQSYDVVLIDLGMPGMPGDRVAMQIRQHDPHVATVLITGWDLPEGDPRLDAFDFHLKKPFSTVDEILSVVSLAVARRDERAAVRE